MAGTEKIPRSRIEAQKVGEVFRSFNRQYLSAEDMLGKLGDQVFFAVKRGEKFSPQKEEQTRIKVLLEGVLKEKARYLEGLCREAENLKRRYEDLKENAAKVVTSEGHKKRVEDLTTEEFADSLVSAVREAIPSQLTEVHAQIETVEIKAEIKALDEGMKRISQEFSRELQKWGDLPHAEKLDKSGFIRELAEHIRKEQEAKDHNPKRPDAAELSKGHMTEANYGKPTAVAEGNIGIVYQARQKYDLDGLNAAGKRIIVPAKEDNVVALKVSKDPSKEPQMQREMALSKKLQGIPGLALPKHLLTVVDPSQYFGFEEGAKVLVFPWIEGVSPEEHLKKIPASRERSRTALQITKSIANRMSQVHQKGIIHRDLKPANVKVDEDGQATILDFGEMVEKGKKAEITSGSWTFMPPEAFQLDYTPNEQADVYALGMTLFILISGNEDPFNINTLGNAKRAEALRRIEEKPIDLSGVDFAPIIAKATEKDPTKRYASMEAMIADLEKALAGKITTSYEKEKARAKLIEKTSPVFGAQLPKSKAEKKAKDIPKGTSRWQEFYGEGGRAV